MNAAVLPITATPGFALTSDQQDALNAFNLFLIDPLETVFLLQGYSGCGKSTLVQTIIQRLPSTMKTVRLIDPTRKDYEIHLTATTNKAAEVLGRLTGYEASTIHSYLGLRVQQNYQDDTTTLVPSNAAPKEGVLLFIDEASYVDKQLLGHIFRMINPKNCKIVFVGDPAQLTPVKSIGTPVWDAGFPGASLTTVVRQAAGNPILDLATKFRETVNTGEFFSFMPDGVSIQHLDRKSFDAAIMTEFVRPDWKYRDSKVLAWTNKRVIAYNHAIRAHVKGDSKFAVGDYAICNNYVTINRQAIKTDQLVEITEIDHGVSRHGISGTEYRVNGLLAFMPDSLTEKNQRVKTARAAQDWKVVAEIEGTWIDLRAAYACTINKAQGSTFNEVFIDLDDVRRCNSGDQIARMLYVAVSRAKSTVYLTGDVA